MKFVRKNIQTKERTSQQNQNNVGIRAHKKNYTSADFKVFFKRYLQSYLKWMYEQNPNFAKYLSIDEVTNFLLQNFVHPIWLQVVMQRKPDRILIEIADYIKKYSCNAEQMEIEMELHPVSTVSNYVKETKAPQLAHVSEDILETNCSQLLQGYPKSWVTEEDYGLFVALVKKKEG